MSGPAVPVSFGPFRLFPATRELEKHGVPLPLGDRALDILIVLIERAGEVVSHRDLIARVWRGLVVSPGSLRVHMAVLRKALGDADNDRRYIENVTGQGYCFVAPIERDVPASIEQTFGPELVAERFIDVIAEDAASNSPTAQDPHQEERAEAFISSDVEYALHCLAFLLDFSGNPVAMSARDLADLQGLSRERLASIFGKLRRAGIVADAEIGGGGFILARAPAKISCLDVIVAIDGRKTLFECKNIRTRCAVFEGKAPQWATKGLCGIHAVMMEAEASVRSVLANRSLTELASRAAARVPPTFIDIIGNWLARRANDDRPEGQASAQ